MGVSRGSGYGAGPGSRHVRMLIPLKAGEPIYGQIYRFVRAQILAGRLPAGARLPSTRAWALQLGVSRTTVLQAFEQLAAEGYVQGVTGSATVVAADLPDSLGRTKAADGSGAAQAVPALSKYAARLLAETEHRPPDPPIAKQPGHVDFHYGNRIAIDFPHRAWHTLVSRRAARAVPSGAPGGGHMALREALAAHLHRTRAVRCNPAQVVIVNGSQQALDLVTRLLVDTGAPVVIENPQYHGARQTFRAAGARLIPCPVDGDGLDVTALPRSPARVALVYVTPSHQFPTGTVLPLARRLALIEWARARQAFILEDDYDGELRYDSRPIEAVQSLDTTGRVIYMGTVSKALTPELRIGYVVLPQSLVSPFLAAKWVADLFAPTAPQMVLAEFFRAGHYDRHLRRLREINARRRGALMTAAREQLADRVAIGGVSAGLHAMLWLPTVPIVELPLLVECASQLGVTLYPVTPYYLGQPTRSGVLAGYSSLSEHEIREGIALFGQALRSRW